MADNLGGLFDSDPGFLEEIASGADETQQPVVQPMAGMVQQNMGMMNPMQQQASRQPHGTMQNMQGNNFGNVPFQSPQQQQYNVNQTNFGQYNNSQMYNQNIIPGPGQAQTGHINPMMSGNPPIRNQFGNQSVSQAQVMYQYGAGGNAVAAAGPRLPNPAQQQMVPIQQQPQQGWGQNQQMFNQQQLPQQQQQQKTYLANQQMHMPQQYQQQKVAQQQPTPAQQQPQNPRMYIQQMKSPPGVNRMPTPSSAQQMPQQQMFQQHNNMASNQAFTNPNLSQATMSMNNDPNLLQQSQQQQFIQQQNQQQNPGGPYKQFPYRTPPQQVVPGMGDNIVSPQGPQTGLIRFPQTSPTHTQPLVQHQRPFNNMNNMNIPPQSRANVPMLSPRPTPPPPSPTVTPGALLSPTGSTSSHQGSFNQMEPSPQPSNNVFPPSANNETVINDMNQPNFNTSQYNQKVSPMQQNANGVMPNTASSMANMNNIGNNSAINTLTNVGNFPNNINQGQTSPNFKTVLSPTNMNTSPTQGNAEIQTLNQQIKQLYSMPQTPQTQQKLLDLQEKLRLVNSQQMLQSQRQQQKQVQQQQPMVQQQLVQQQMPPQPPGGTVTFQLNINTSTPQSGLQPTLQPGTQPVPQAGALQQGQKIQLVQQQPGQSNTGQQILIIKQQPQPGLPAPTNQQQLVQPLQQQQPLLSPAQTVQATPLHTPPLPTVITHLPQPRPSVPPSQHIIINQGLASGGKAQLLAPSTLQQLPPLNNENVTMATVNDITGVSSTVGPAGASQQQEKANKIIAEAIAKAQKSGNSTLPRVLEPPELPSTLTDMDQDDNKLVIAEDGTKAKKKKRKYTPKKDREKDKEKRPKSEKKKGKKDKKAKLKIEGEMSMDTSIGEDVKTEEEIDVTALVDGEMTGLEVEKEKKPKKKKSSSDKRPKSKKPPATFLKSKKRKRRGSSDGSDVEVKITPPPSPENEDLKRRSGRHVKRKKYLDDVDLNLSEEDADVNVDVVGGGEGAVVKPVQLFVDNPAEEDAVIVDKILGVRIRKRDPDDEDADENEEEVEEFYVKYKNFSYLHCEWKAENEIKDKRIAGKIRRYQQKKMFSNFLADDEELFNPDYVEVDRVLEESTVHDPVTGEDVVHYLVKWQSMAYEDSTWELQQDVNPEKVELFKKYRELPPEEDREYKARPKASEWKALEKTYTYKGGNVLREYQLEGVNWISFCWHKKQNCILADEMGLGKTIQSITFLQEMFSYGIKGPFLVIAPLSTIANWQREFETWTDLNAITYHGTSPSRYMLQEYEMYYRDDEGGKITDFYRFHAIVTTYEVILSDLELLKSIQWRCIIIDEAHRLKNKNCSLIKSLRMFNFDHKVLLTGTPLQNNVEELFSLLNFLEPSQFHSSEAFLAEFGTLRTEEQVDKLKAILKPMMLRRLKEDVEKNLAAKEETIIEVELTNIQKKYYRAILEKNFTYLCKGTQTAGNLPSLMNTMMELRKCCNHPYLINGAEENILSELRERHKVEPEHITALIQASGKFVLLDKLLPKLKQNGNRVLIFSQMIRVLDIIEDYLINKRYLYERLDGRIRGNLRQEAIDRYSKPDSDRFVFLICTKAGGLGINLTAADTVIIYDSDWNPQNDLQAQARCHRIGQQKMVKVYRLITRNSYEREMFDRAGMKLGLDKAVLQSMGGEKINPTEQLSKREIEDLLRKGAYGALMEDDEQGDKFCEEDIDQILRGRTQVVQIESEGKGSTFAKASFSVTASRDDIDIDDPEFWQKWAKKNDMDMEDFDKKDTIIDEPRVRRKTARYGNNDSIADMSDLGSDSDGSDEDGKGKKGRRGRRGGDDDDEDFNNDIPYILGKKGRRGRRGADDDDEDFEKERHQAKARGSGYGRSELFKVEKGLLHYGWGRWPDILAHSRFKRNMEEKDVENVAKAILLYGLQYYKGDERIKEFIWDLISKDAEDGGLKNHSGLSAPVPRGRKGKKAKTEESHFDANEEIEKAGIKMDRDIIHNKNAYKRHIHRHSNKVLLRVRTLFYIKHEVLGDMTIDQINQGLHVRDINALAAPMADNEPPAYWWDEVADKSLLIGVYKHGYEKYNLMRQDPLLIFLEKCGPPDGAALAAEMKDDDDNEGDDLEDTINIKDDEDEESLSCAPDVLGTPKSAPRPTAGPTGEEGEEGKMPFPTVSEMNTRLRRIITTYQRDFKKQQLKKQQLSKKVEKREKLDAVFRERETKKKETQLRWTRREETDFYRIVSTYGIEFDRVKGRYIWDKFRHMARLEKKTDEQLTEYFISFYHMCLRVCRKIKEEAYPPTPVYIEAITEERANRCIARIDLLSKIREEIIVHPKMEARIKACQKSLDLPTWWCSGKHDRELLIGAAKHGLARTDDYIANDPSMSFMEAIKVHLQSVRNSPAFQNNLTGKDLKTDKDKVAKDNDKSQSKENGPLGALKSEETSKVKTEKDDGEKSSDIKTEKSAKEMNGEQSNDSDSDDSPKSPKKDTPNCVEKMEIEENGCEDSKSSDQIKKEKTESAVVKSEIKTESDDIDSDKPEDLTSIKTENKESAKSDAKDSDKAEVTDSIKTETKDSDSEPKDKNKDKPIVENGIEEEDIKKEGKTENVKDEDEEVRVAMEGKEFLISVSDSLLSQWPKDRIVFHRLEQICYCIETGDWPFPPKMKNTHILGIDSGSSNTPTRSLTPCLTPKIEDESKEAAEQQLLAQKKKDKEFDVQIAQGDGLKMTFHKKAERHKRSMDSLQEAEKTARIQAILAQSLAASAACSSDDSQQDSALLSTQVSWPSPWQSSPPFYNMSSIPHLQGGSESPFLNGSHMTEEEMLMNRSLMEQSMMFGGERRGRRGRKRKAEKMAEIAMAEALSRRQTARAIASFDHDSHVPVLNLEDGSRLSGDEAPLKKDLDTWLDKHPGYMVDSRDEEIEQGEIVPDYPERRKGRKPKFDPAFLDVEKLTGEENVSVINRLTGKKITGAKAPPLRYLAEWLEQNPMWDVDPKWAELVRAKGSLPKTLLPRVVTPSRRGRRPRDSPLSHSMMGGGDPHQAAALAASIEAMNAAQLMAAGYGKMPMPFGSIPGLGMGHPLLGFGFPGMTASSPLPTEKSSESKHKDSSSSKDDVEKGKDGEKSASSSPHPSFPFMINPLMYNPALLAQAQGLSFPLPTSLGALGTAGLINGHSPIDEDTRNSKSKSRHVSDSRNQSQAEDLSVKSKKSVIENTIKAHSRGKPKPNIDVQNDSDEMPCDLSMKPKSKEDKSKQKICSSDKLSRIVDTLKFRVNKMDEKPNSEDKQSKRNSLDALLSAKESSSSKNDNSDPISLTKKDSLSSLSHKSSSASSQNHSSKEPVPKIVQELLAAKQQKDKEEYLVAKQQKLDALLAKKQKLVKDSLAKQKLLSSQESMEENDNDNDDVALETEDGSAGVKS